MTVQPRKGAIDLVALREKAERNGQRDSEDGPVWELPSWATVRTLLHEIDRLEGQAKMLRAVIEE